MDQSGSVPSSNAEDAAAAMKKKKLMKWSIIFSVAMVGLLILCCAAVFLINNDEEEVEIFAPMGDSLSVTSWINSNMIQIQNVQGMDVSKLTISIVDGSDTVKTFNPNFSSQNMGSLGTPEISSPEYITEIDADGKTLWTTADGEDPGLTWDIPGDATITLYTKSEFE